MQTIGLLGGMSWESTLTYYKNINEGIRKKLGGLHSAKIAMYSLDFEPIEQLQHKGDWEGAAKILAEAAQNIERAGADFLLLCTNTMHTIAARIESSITIPFVHIVDATAESITAQGMQSVGLLGTAFTMEQGFYKDRLEERFGIRVLTPDKEDRKLIHSVIYQELCLGKISFDSKKEYLRIIRKLADRGAQAIVLGCTEIGLLINQEDTEVTLMDTAVIHAEKAVELAIAQQMNAKRS